jgi:hypothetical protein
MADIHFSSWTTAYDLTEATSLVDSEILMSSLGELQQEGIVELLSRGGSWVVVAHVDCLAPGVQEALEDLVLSQVVLPMERRGKEVVCHPKVYAKGWWRTGSKRLCRPRGEIRLWWGDGEGDMDLTPLAGTPVVDGAFGGAAMTGQVRFYLDSTPSGPFLHNKGMVVWTDWSRRKGAEDDEVRAGMFCATVPSATMEFAVGWERKAA